MDEGDGSAQAEAGAADPCCDLLSGVLSAFFVKDLVGLAMVPPVLTIARKLRLEPVPYLLYWRGNSFEYWQRWRPSPAILRTF